MVSMPVRLLCIVVCIAAGQWLLLCITQEWEMHVIQKYMCISLLYIVIVLDGKLYSI